MTHQTRVRPPKAQPAAREFKARAGDSRQGFDAAMQTLRDIREEGGMDLIYATISAGLCALSDRGLNDDDIAQHVSRAASDVGIGIKVTPMRERE